MKNLKLIKWMTFVFISLFLVVITYTLIISQDKDISKAADNQTTSLDPCWFTKPKEQYLLRPEEIRKRQNRLEYGYPDEIPLTEALRIFNEERRCYSDPELFPDLSEDEFLSAVEFGVDFGKEGESWLKQKVILNHILTKKTMPKGTLINSIEGMSDSFSDLKITNRKGQVIYLFVNIDKELSHDSYMPEQVFIIRKTFVRTS